MQSENTQSRRKQHEYAGWLVLFAYLLFLVYRARCHATGGETPTLSLWELRDPRWIVGRIGGSALGALCDFACFIPVGFGVAILVCSRLGQVRRPPISLRTLVMGIATVVLVCATKIAGAWVIISLTCPFLGCVFGAWAGATWRRGWLARLWFVPKVALLIFLVTLCMGVAVRLSLEDKPYPFEAARVSSAEKRRLVHLVRSKSPESLEEGQTHTLRLTDHDLNVVSSWGLSSEVSGRKANVSMDQNSVSLSLCAPVPLGGGRSCYLNLQMTGDAEIENGVFRMCLSRCRIGPASVPGWFLRPLCPLLSSFLNHNTQVKPFLDATKRMTIESNSIQLTYGPLDWPAGTRRSFLGPAFASEELLASMQAQVDHLLLLFAAHSLPDQLPSFNLCLRTAFALARERSAQHDAVTENQAAIFALGILLGHPGIEDLLGPVLDDRDRNEARQALLRVALHGRSDWTRHFCVSAVIAILSDEAVSDACGLLKEELDTDADGSGFSFADLLMDRAGTAFAVRATRNEATARTLQGHLACGFHIESICPPADGLPEGVCEADLKSRYGGVGGGGYRRLIEEIERRVAACAAYR